MFVTLVTTVPFYGVKEDIPSDTGGGQTVKDVFERHFVQYSLPQYFKTEEFKHTGFSVFV